MYHNFNTSCIEINTNRKAMPDKSSESRKSKIEKSLGNGWRDKKHRNQWKKVQVHVYCFIPDGLRRTLPFISQFYISSRPSLYFSFHGGRSSLTLSLQHDTCRNGSMIVKGTSVVWYLVSPQSTILCGQQLMSLSHTHSFYSAVDCWWSPCAGSLLQMCGKTV